MYLAYMILWYYFYRPNKLELHDLCTELESPQNLRSLLGLGLTFFPAPRFTYNEFTKTLKRFKWELYIKTYHVGSDRNGDYNPCMYVPSTWMPQWWQIPKKISIKTKEFEAAAKSFLQNKLLRHNLLPHHRRALHWLRIQEDLLIVKFDKNSGPAIIEHDVYIERVCIDHLYQRYTYLYLPPALAASKMAAIKLKFGAWIKRHSKHLTKMEFFTYHKHAS